MSSDTNGAETNGSPVKLARKDFQSDQEVRWCPGCGDYGILAAIQFLLPELGVNPDEMVFVSGIGCAARLPYYMNTYGVHSIHGRAPAVAMRSSQCCRTTKPSKKSRLGTGASSRAWRVAPFIYP